MTRLGWILVVVILVVVLLVVLWPKGATAWTEIRNTAGITYLLDDETQVTVESNEGTTMVAERPRLTVPQFAVRGSGEEKTFTVQYDVGTNDATVHLPLQGGTYVDGSLVVEGTSAEVLGIVSGRLDVRLVGVDPPATVQVRYDVTW